MTATTGHGIRYLTGGVGSDERERLESRGADYNLKIEFATKSGNFLTDVKLVVLDEQGREVVNDRFEGPWVYLKLPHGKYRFVASFNGEQTGASDVVLQQGERERRIVSWDVETD